MAPGEDYDAARERAVHRVEDDPEAVPDTYAVYVVHIDEMEFFQGAPDHAHVRLRYQLVDEVWRRGLLWP
ncbi:MAG TPA: pyridoxine 5'-phosphate oxidase C-terminal domain-containing protein, partial [Streptomyces sp.]|nr:pyridoxine 5'-phosphate oxidase C-terminal domain-containing protein [Streptomyces sp.]